MNPFLDSLVGKSLVHVNGVPEWVPAIKAGKQALRDAPKHASLRGMKVRDAEHANEMRERHSAYRAILRAGGTLDGQVTVKGKQGNHVYLGIGGNENHGYYLPLPVKGKSQRRAHHVIAINDGDSLKTKYATYRHEKEHSQARKQLSRQVKFMRHPLKLWGEEARADSAMPPGTKSVYEDAARKGTTTGSLPDSDFGRKRYLALRKKATARNGTKGTDPIPLGNSIGKSFPTSAFLHGLPGNEPRMVRVVGMVGKDTFKVEHKDQYIVAHRGRLTFVKGPKLSDKKPSAPRPPAPRKPKFAQPALFDAKGRVNPAAKPPK